MTWKMFFLELLRLISADIFLGFLVYILWKYIDMKYFSKLEISTLIEENKYLKNENKKINGNNTSFWNEEEMKKYDN